MSAQRTAYDAWTRRLSVAALLAAVPLVLFGGSVTTLGAGMAVDGWLIAEGHFLLFFPLDSWLRDTATFVEHTHRLFGVLVGFCALGACARAWVARRGLGALAPTAALLMVCAQGALGGLRVLADSSDLAFIHGVFAQATFAALALSALLASRAFAEVEPGARPHDGGRLSGLALAASLVVLVQVGIGAWYRHGLRTGQADDPESRLALHFAGAAAVFLALALLGGALKRAAAQSAPPGAHALRRSARRLHLLLGVQILLGLCAWVSRRPDAIGPFEWGLSIAHVLCGALLLAECAAAAAWALRLAPRARSAMPALEVAR
jgi:cytochrome c oxidase assembly protein subunit 15